MSSVYPGGLDSFDTNRTDATPNATTQAADHNDYADAINQIEATLGVDPQGSFSTVVERLDNGGSQPIEVATANVSSAQILAMPGTPAEIVAAPSNPAHAIIPIAVAIRTNFVTTPYTPAGDAFYYISTAEELASGNGGFYGMSPTSDVVALTSSSITLMRPTSDVLTADVKGKALVLTTGSAFTGGDGTLTVTTWYALVTLP